MTAAAWLQIVVFFGVLTALVPVLGGYMARVYQGQPIVLDRVLGPVERRLYRLLRTDPAREQDWKGYARSVLLFNLVGFLVLYAILRTQGAHPLNPQNLSSGPWDLSFNTAASFTTNTNWQFYGGETTLSYFSQMAGLAVQNFLSAAVGIAVCIAVIRGFARRATDRLGNFWADVTRTLLYVLLPISLIGALFLVSQGVLQSFDAYRTVDTIAGGEQTLAFGPVASQEIIKELGTNGGGFFNVNASMPFENASGLTNAFLMLMILAIPAALTGTFGRMVGSRRQGWAIYAAMSAMFLAGVLIVSLSEDVATPAMQAAGLDGGNLEGKETRFGIGSSSLFAVVTTVASCGAVNAAMESLTGLGGAVPMANMMTG
jgi:K+-transporting ATPase ATPase A chain